MILLHEWRRHKFLVPNPLWKPASDKHDSICFVVKACLHDGHVVWRGVFRDRDDFDQFLYSIATGEICYDTFVQRLPVPEWDPALLDLPLAYHFRTYIFKTTTGTGTFSRPADWVNSDNHIQGIAGGANGHGNGTQRVGGGSGAFAGISNQNIAASTNYQVGAVATATYWNQTDLGCCNFTYDMFADPANGQTGGLAANCTGSTKFSGANGGSSASGNPGAGGAGAGGLTAAGNVGANGTVSASGAGGQGEGSVGGTGGASRSTSGTGNPGNPGTNLWDLTKGPGGGGGGGVGSNAGGAAGLYGAGGGQAQSAGDGTLLGAAGAGAQGILTVDYQPAGGLFLPTPLNGIGAGGAFFTDPLDRGFSPSHMGWSRSYEDNWKAIFAKTAKRSPEKKRRKRKDNFDLLPGMGHNGGPALRAGE